MMCRIHPKYEVNKRPKVACEACWALWFQHVWTTEYGCKLCSFQPTSSSDYCGIYRPPPNLIVRKK